jgi:antibiotic biosynthesis monooxygenase (ABM) superfamily enzyme
MPKCRKVPVGDDLVAELNDEGREVWFSRVMWSYMPAHWKGVLYPTLIIAVAVPICLLVDDFNPILSFIPLLSVWALVMWICERHSPSRR